MSKLKFILVILCYLLLIGCNRDIQFMDYKIGSKLGETVDNVSIKSGDTIVHGTIYLHGSDKINSIELEFSHLTGDEFYLVQSRIFDEYNLSMWDFDQIKGTTTYEYKLDEHTKLIYNPSLNNHYINFNLLLTKY